MNERLLAAWNASVRDLDAPAPVQHATQTGGRLKLSGRPALFEDWFRRRFAEQGGRFFCLDLEGWEPGSETLVPFAEYQATLRGLELPAWIRDALELEDSVGPQSATRVVCMLELMIDLGDAVEPAALQELFDADDLGELLHGVRELIGPGTAAIWVPEGDLLPVSLSRALSDLCRPDSQWLWLDRQVEGSEPPDWRLDDDSMSSAYGQAVAETARELVTRLRADGASADAVRQLGEAVALWALADGSAPLEPILVAMGLDEAARENIIDLLDDVLAVEPNADGLASGVLLDLQYTHPSFAEAVYRPAHPAWIDVLLHDRPDAQQAVAALHLAKAMARHEGRGRTLRTWWLRLAYRGADADPSTPVGPPVETEDIEATRLRMRWETAGVETEDLLNERRTQPTLEELWTLAASPSLAPDQRLTFLDSWQRRASSDHPLRHGDLALLKAEILRLLERPEDALTCLDGLLRQRQGVSAESAPERIRHLLSAMHLAATLLLEAEQSRQGLEMLGDCVELAKEALPEDDPKHMTLVSNYGRALMQGGRLRQAREVLERALAMTEAARGDRHPSTGLALNNLAGLLMETGDLEVAQSRLRRAIEIFEATLGPHSLELYGALRNLVQVTEQLGGESLALWERLAALEEAITRGRHPALVATWTRLAELRREHGDDDGARRLYERALELAVVAYYGDHPSIPALRQALDALSSTEAGQDASRTVS